MQVTIHFFLITNSNLTALGIKSVQYGNGVVSSATTTDINKKEIQFKKAFTNTPVIMLVNDNGDYMGGRRLAYKNPTKTGFTLCYQGDYGNYSYSYIAVEFY